MIEKGNMTDAEYIAALISENKSLKIEIKSLEKEKQKITNERNDLECKNEKLEIWTIVNKVDRKKHTKS